MYDKRRVAISKVCSFETALNYGSESENPSKFELLNQTRPQNAEVAKDFKCKVMCNGGIPKEQKSESVQVMKGSKPGNRSKH
ncbi:hypothetical protein M514_11421 [Trichuris suis]|uniref:Uncharacterized protein n=1 Tax=Trichuris suis TaxID=68888 RepID=A0A085LRU2_9BILA|nr:hypothetical protein M513_11421 [Trichuris suis]KFD59442.1 hypothetical protein M514_11421 [Trichuris suis]